MAGNITEVSATGDITTESTYLLGVSLTAGADTATLVVKAGGSSGTKVLGLSAVAGTSAVFDAHGIFLDDGIHATLTGTSPSATFVYE